MKYLYLCCASLLLALGAVAQRNYVPATLLLTGRDSLQGQVDYRKWDNTPHTISFREKEGAAAREYGAADIKGFRIAENNETYLSLPAELDITKETVDVLSSFSDREIINGTYFFRVMMDGPVRLLLYTDRYNRQHFSVMEQDSATPLIKKKVYINNPGAADHSTIKTHSFYRQQLAHVVQNCIPAQRLANLDYSETAIRKVLQQYVACRYPGQQVTIRKADEGMRSSFGIMAGVGLNHVKLSGSHSLARGDYSGKASPVVGIFMDIPLSRNRQKLSWNNEVIYTTRAFSGGRHMAGGFYNEVDVNLQFVQLQSLLKYTFPKGNLRPYVNAGVAGAIHIGGKDELAKTREYADTRDVEPALDGGRSFFLPLMAGVGLRYNNLHVELRLTAPHNMSVYRLLDAMNTTGQLLVRYSLF